MVKNGLFISLEGIHGCGKTTVATMLCEELESRHLSVTYVVDQGGTLIGKALRKINLCSENVYPLTEAFIIAAARCQNVAELIRPELSSGNIVVSERFNDALFAFQGFGRGLPMDLLKVLSDAISDGIEPDITYLLDLDPLIGISRINPDKRHRIEQEPLSFHNRVREGYCDQARKHTGRIKIVDASRSIDQVFEEVLAVFDSTFKQQME